MQILIAGESWVTHSTHIKGFDTFTTCSYEEGVGWLKGALERSGHAVQHMPNHLVSRDFPGTIDELRAYQLVILSDCGSNNLLLHPDTFVHSQATPNRLTAIGDYVQHGGALLMIGGYMSFQGIDGKARYRGTAVEMVLPAILQSSDDRVELPEGQRPQVVAPDHPILQGIIGEWPHFLGYNRFVARDGAEVLVRMGDDPFLAVTHVGRGRSAAFASDCGPHWGPPEYLGWAYHDRFWAQLVAWLTQGS